MFNSLTDARSSLAEMDGPLNEIEQMFDEKEKEIESINNNFIIY